MKFKSISTAIKRTLTFVLAFAMVATSLYVAPAANAEEIEEGVVSDEASAAEEEIVISDEAASETVIEDIIVDAEAEEEDAAAPIMSTVTFEGVDTAGMSVPTEYLGAFVGAEFGDGVRSKLYDGAEWVEIYDGETVAAGSSENKKVGYVHIDDVITYTPAGKGADGKIYVPYYGKPDSGWGDITDPIGHFGHIKLTVDNLAGENEARVVSIGGDEFRFYIQKSFSKSAWSGYQTGSQNTIVLPLDETVEASKKEKKYIEFLVDKDGMKFYKENNLYSAEMDNITVDSGRDRKYVKEKSGSVYGTTLVRIDLKNVVLIDKGVAPLKISSGTSSAYNSSVTGYYGVPGYTESAPGGENKEYALSGYTVSNDGCTVNVEVPEGAVQYQDLTTQTATGTILYGNSAQNKGYYLVFKAEPGDLAKGVDRDNLATPNMKVMDSKKQADGTWKDEIGDRALPTAGDYMTIFLGKDVATAKAKKVELTVDWDGFEKTEGNLYLPTKYVFDLSNVNFVEENTTPLTLTLENLNRAYNGKAITEADVLGALKIDTVAGTKGTDNNYTFKKGGVELTVTTNVPAAGFTDAGKYEVKVTVKEKSGDTKYTGVKTFPIEIRKLNLNSSGITGAVAATEYLKVKFQDAAKGLKAAPAPAAGTTATEDFIYTGKSAVAANFAVDTVTANYTEAKIGGKEIKDELDRVLADPKGLAIKITPDATGVDSLTDVTTDTTGPSAQITVNEAVSKNIEFTITKNFKIGQADPTDVISFNYGAAASTLSAEGVTEKFQASATVKIADVKDIEQDVAVVVTGPAGVGMTSAKDAVLVKATGNEYIKTFTPNIVTAANGAPAKVTAKVALKAAGATAASTENQFKFVASFKNYKDILVTVTVETEAALAATEGPNKDKLEWTGDLAKLMNESTAIIGYLGRGLTDKDITGVAAKAGDKGPKGTVAPGSVTFYKVDGDARIQVEAAQVKDLGNYEAVATYTYTKAAEGTDNDSGEYKFTKAFEIKTQDKVGGGGVLSGITLNNATLNYSKADIAALLTYGANGAELAADDIVSVTALANCTKAFSYRTATDKTAASTSKDYIDLTGNGLTNPIKNQPTLTVVVKNDNINATAKVIIDIEKSAPDANANVLTYTATFNYEVPTKEFDPDNEDEPKIVYVKDTKKQTVEAGKKLVAPKIGKEVGWRNAATGVIWNFDTDVVSGDIELDAVYATVDATSGYTLYDVSPVTYNGKAQKPAVVVVDAAGNVLKASKYTVTYDGAKTVKDAKDGVKVAVTVKKTKTMPAVTLNSTVDVKPAAIDSVVLAGITVLKGASPSWTKKDIAAVKTVKAGKVSLRLGKDYTYQLLDGETTVATVSSGKAPVTKPGAYSVKIVPANKNFTIDATKDTYGTVAVADSTSSLGKAKVTYDKKLPLPAYGKEIQQKITVTLGTYSATWDGTAATPAWVGAAGSEKFAANLDDLKTGWNGGVGTMTLVVKAKDKLDNTDAYVFGEKAAKYSVSAAADQKIKKTASFNKIAPQTYTGEGITIQDIVADGTNVTTDTSDKNAEVVLLNELGFTNKEGKALTKTDIPSLSTFVNITYTKNVNAGTAKITVVAAPKSGKTGKFTTSFKIVPMNIEAALKGDATNKIDPAVAIATSKIKVDKGAYSILTTDVKTITNKSGKTTGYAFNEADASKLLANIMNDAYLKDKVDYTVKYDKKNNALVITGKGNYDKKSKISVSIVAPKTEEAATGGATGGTAGK